MKSLGIPYQYALQVSGSNLTLLSPFWVKFIFRELKIHLSACSKNKPVLGTMIIECSYAVSGELPFDHPTSTVISRHWKLSRTDMALALLA